MSGVGDAWEVRALAEERARARWAAEFEAYCPHVLGNPFIPHFPLPKQSAFLGAHMQLDAVEADEVYQALFGGAAGGGKSDALLMGAAQYAWKHPEFAGVCLRRSYAQLAQPGALMDRAHMWWNKNNGVHWNGTDKIFTFPSGARVKMAYHGTAADNENFQSSEYQYAAFDELTHWPDPSAYEWIALSRLRRPEGSALPLRALSASNPGGRGHIWVRDRFVGGIDLETGAALEAPCDYFPARIVDNPYLDRAAYVRSLMRLHPTTRAQLLEGDWSAREPGDYFRREWFGPLLDAEADAWPNRDKISVRWWDLAASEKPDACYTAGVLMSRHRFGVRAIEHCTSFRATPGKRDDLIVQQAKLDGYHVVVGIEIEPGSGGIAQYLALEKRLRAAGHRVTGARPQTMSEQEKQMMIRAPTSENAKALRCAPVSSCLERGHQRRGECDDTGGEWWGLDVGRQPNAERDGIRLYAGPWTQSYLDVVEGFPGEGRMDEADATSGAWAWLETHPWGQRVAASRALDRESIEWLDVNPSDRPEDRGTEKSTAGHWNP